MTIDDHSSPRFILLYYMFNPHRSFAAQVEVAGKYAPGPNHEHRSEFSYAPLLQSFPGRDKLKPCG